MPQFNPGIAFDGVFFILVAIVLVGLAVWLLGGWRK